MGSRILSINLVLPHRTAIDSITGEVNVAFEAISFPEELSAMLIY